jgi:hypothetical protein
MPKKYYRKNKRGGNNPNLPYSQPVKYGGAGEPYSSASSYGTYVNGSGDSQYNRVFSQSSPDASNPSNNIWGVQGQNLTMPQNPTNQQLSLIQSAGARRRSARRMSKSRMSRSRSRSRRGGNFGQVISQAVVPFSLLALQQTFRRKGKKSQKKQTKRRFRK